jgi:hypothetical protein
MIGSGILLLPLLWLVISVLLLGFNHLVSDWLLPSPRIKLRISWDDAKGRRSICSAYGRLVFFIWLDCFTVIQTGVIAAIAVTFANYSAIFFRY